MAKIQIKPNHAGIGQIAKSSEMFAMLRVHTERIADRAGEGFEASTRLGKSRAVGVVRSVTHEARLAEAEDRALTRALHAVKGS